MAQVLVSIALRQASILPWVFGEGYTIYCSFLFNGYLDISQFLILLIKKVNTTVTLFYDIDGTKVFQYLVSSIVL